jgi:hypothetical protein
MLIWRHPITCCPVGYQDNERSDSTGQGNRSGAYPSGWEQGWPG